MSESVAFNNDVGLHLMGSEVSSGYPRHYLSSTRALTVIPMKDKGPGRAAFPAFRAPDKHLPGRFVLLALVSLFLIYPYLGVPNDRYFHEGKIPQCMR
jgi:hypothetical protein